MDQEDREELERRGWRGDGPHPNYERVNVGDRVRAFTKFAHPSSCACGGVWRGWTLDHEVLEVVGKRDGLLWARGMHGVSGIGCPVLVVPALDDPPS